MYNLRCVTMSNKFMLCMIFKRIITRLIKLPFMLVLKWNFNQSIPF